MVVDHLSATHQQKLKIPFDIIREGNVEAFVEILINESEQYISQLEKHFIGVIEDVTSASGNVLDVKGAELSFEHLIQLVEGIELRIDDTGQLGLPTLMMNPSMREKFETLQPTAEQLERFNQMLERKRQHITQNKRSRQLGK